MDLTPFKRKLISDFKMISVIARSSGAAQLSAVRQAVPSGIVPIASGYSITEKILVSSPPQTHTSFTAAKYLPTTSGIGSRGPRALRSLTGINLYAWRSLFSFTLGQLGVSATDCHYRCPSVCLRKR